MMATRVSYRILRLGGGGGHFFGIVLKLLTLRDLRCNYAGIYKAHS